MTDDEYIRVRAFLQQARMKDSAIKRKQLQIRELESCLLPGAIRYDVDRVQSSPSDPMSRIMAEIDDLEHQIEQLKIEKAEAVTEVSRMIDKLEDETEKTVLADYFIGRAPMTEVADIIGYGVRQTFRIRKRGIENMAELLKDVSECQ